MRPAAVVNSMALIPESIVGKSPTWIKLERRFNRCLQYESIKKRQALITVQLIRWPESVILGGVGI
jgi:hypothetical protein